MLQVFKTLSTLKLLQEARKSLVNHDWSGAANTAIKILTQLGFDAVAKDIQATIDAIGTGNLEPIATASMQLILDVINAYLGFGKPITTSASVSLQTAETVATRIELAIDRIDHAINTAPKGFTTGSPTGAPIDPQTILVAFQILQQVFSFFYSQIKKQPTVVVAPAPTV